MSFWQIVATHWGIGEGIGAMLVVLAPFWGVAAVIRACRPCKCCDGDDGDDGDDGEESSVEVTISRAA